MNLDPIISLYDSIFISLYVYPVKKMQPRLLWGLNLDNACQVPSTNAHVSGLFHLILLIHLIKPAFP